MIGGRGGQQVVREGTYTYTPVHRGSHSPFYRGDVHIHTSTPWVAQPSLQVQRTPLPGALAHLFLAPLPPAGGVRARPGEARGGSVRGASRFQRGARGLVPQGGRHARGYTRGRPARAQPQQPWLTGAVCVRHSGIA
eukprot:1046972-Prymnesium_polylepis.1